jgi:indolepyruvate ferredoxin oxidoreductase
MLGVAYQQGLVPLSAAAIRKAFELNGIEVDFNLQSFDWGRLWVQDATLVEDRASPGMVHVSPPVRTIDESIALRVDELQRYQNARYAERYRALMTRVSAADPAPAKAFTEAVMRNAFKLMAYKDEYEVARLYTDGRFRAALEAQFEGDYRLELHLAPPLLSRRDKETGHPRKMILGPWMLRAMRLLAPLRRLRGTPFDLFGRTAERRQERALITDYLDMLERLLPRLGQVDYALAVSLARLPEQIRGFGHVKEASIAAAALERDRLLARLDGQSISPSLAAE